MTRFHKNPNKFVTHVVLKVEDIKRSTQFYKNIMGFKELRTNEREVVFTADGITPMITIIEPNDVIPKLPRRTGLYHFAILLPSRYYLGLFLKHIKNNNYPIIGGANHGVSEAIYLQDPDDNGIEVYSDLSVSKWRKKEGKIDMVTEILDYSSLLNDAGDNSWEGLPHDTILGHIHLHVSDLEEARRFYVDTLGFDLVTEMSRSALFISSGGYHHHLGLNIWNGRGALPLPDNSAGMKYYSLNISDGSKEDIIHKLKKSGYEVFEKDGKTFTLDPSHNLIELI